ncbi:acyl-CoA dehydrogenase family protein [Microtetraspora malaysiensis]|uniref:Acyl-CoA dehydrogenase family protein n=1 Tax=Microtetraspora malaysiensis TaxID=161358 RepID=A0ABW6SPA3_9ACTN
MTDLPPPRSMPDTVGLNPFTASPVLPRILHRWLDDDAARWAAEHCTGMGELAAGPLDELAATADLNGPRLRPYDKRGVRVDEVEFHPAWDGVVDVAYRRFGIAAMSHREGVLGWPGRAPEVAKQALFFLLAHADRNVVTGLTMTDVLARVLRLYAPELAERYLPRLTATDGNLWQAAMFLTEKAGGSDVGVNETEARLDADGSWRLYGDKWFCSNCQADLILTLARPQGAGPGTDGLGLFLVRRTLDDGSRNAYVINRLKDKLGTRGLASGEVTFTGAYAELVGGPGVGFRQMTEMLNQTRVANSVVAAALVHRAYLEAREHATGRAAFGRRLSDHPLMREVLADLALATETSTRLAFYTAGLLQRSDAGDRVAGVLLRTLTPLVKYHTARQAQWACHEAMEVRGGNGYIEDWPNARMVRDAHLLSIWEGSGNIMLLDFARALRRTGSGSTLVEALAAPLGPTGHTADNTAGHTAGAFAGDPLGAAVREKAAAWARELADWERLPPEEAQFALRGLAERCLHILSAGLLAADAAEDLRGGDARLAVLARRHERAWRAAPEPPDRALSTGFPGLISGAAVDPSVLEVETLHG